MMDPIETCCKTLASFLAILWSSLLWTPRTLAQEIPDQTLLFRPPDEASLFGRELPDIRLIRADGNTEMFSDLWQRQPIFVTLVFSRCAGICSPYMGLLRDTIDQVGSCGDRYRMVVISFDLRDDPAALTALAEHHGLRDHPGWTFAVPASEDDLNQLCQSLDFDFRWDETRQQYNHPAVTVAVRHGKLVRLSVGEEISPGRFKEMLAEARGEFVPIYPIPGQSAALFRCFDYDPARGFTPNWGMLLLVFPGVAAIAIIAGIFGFSRLTATSRQSRSALPIHEASNETQSVTPR